MYVEDLCQFVTFLFISIFPFFHIWVLSYSGKGSMGVRLLEKVLF